jgi:hypothetical protein
VIVVAKVSSVYVSCYLGFMAPYMAPGAFPYPLVVGGNLSFNFSEPATGDGGWRWSNSTSQMRNFPIPLNSTLSSAGQSSLQLRLSSGSWQQFGSYQGEQIFGQVWPYAYVDSAGAWDWRPNLDGGYPLLPIVLTDPTPNVYGELEGVHAVTGFGQSSENTITVAGVQYLVVQDVFRNSKSDFFAVRLS